MQQKSLWWISYSKVSKSDLWSFLTPQLFSGFKKELFGYFLEYTAGLIEALVAARDPDKDPYAKALNELISNHTDGPFNDYRVSIAHLIHNLDLVSKYFQEFLFLVAWLHRRKKETSFCHEHLLQEDSVPGPAAGCRVLAGRHPRCDAHRALRVRPLHWSPPRPGQG